MVASEGDPGTKPREKVSRSMLALMIIGAIAIIAIVVMIGAGCLFIYLLINNTPANISPTPTPAVSVQASPGLALDYSNMKTHEIIGSPDGVLTDYQMKFTVHRGTGKDNGSDLYLNGNSTSWPYDIRFKDASGALLSYWIESFDHDSATVWVKISSIPQGPDITFIDVYYGKNNDPGASNGDSTFVFFDHFDGASLNTGKWHLDNTGSSYSYSLNNGALYITESGSTAFSVGSKTKVGPYGYAFEMLAKSSDTGGIGIGADSRSDGSGNLTFAKVLNDSFAEYYSNCNDGIYSNYSRSTNYHNYHRLSIQWSSTEVKYLESGLDKADITTNVPAIPMGLQFSVNGVGNITVDWCAIRKYTLNEPTQGAWED